MLKLSIYKTASLTDTQKVITNDAVIFYIILIENVELSVGDSLL